MSFIAAMFSGFGSSKFETPLLATIWFIVTPIFGYLFYNQVGVTEGTTLVLCMYGFATPIVLVYLALSLERVNK